MKDLKNLEIDLEKNKMINIGEGQKVIPFLKYSFYFRLPHLYYNLKEKLYVF